MNSHGNRVRLGGILAALAAVVALVALPGVASGDRVHDEMADAGTIESFDPASGVLTIDLTEGGSVSGLVTPRTHVHCDNGRHEGRHGLRHLRHGATASDRGSNSGEGGEDNHRHGEEEPGDDPPGHDGTAPGRSEGPGRGDERGESCGSEDLTAGKTVKFADLALVDGKAIWSVVALPKSEEEAPPTGS